MLRQQFPSGIGLRKRKIGRQRLVEINFASAAERDEALMKPFNIQNQPIKISKTLDKNADVVRIGISEIPHEQEDFLKFRLIELFSKYGEILEIGIRFIEDGHWFNGQGFVTLNRDKTKQFLELEPQIPSWEEGHFLSLNWNTMKPICTYCHACYLCGSYGHLRAKCLETSWNKNNKRSRNESPSRNRHLTLGNFLPSTVSSTVQLLNEDIEDRSSVDKHKDNDMTTHNEETTLQVEDRDKNSMDLSMTKDDTDMTLVEEDSNKEPITTNLEQGMKTSILLFQETNIPSDRHDRISEHHNLQLQSKQATSSQYCGMINYNNNLQIQTIQQADDGRYILISVNMPEEPTFQPIYILNIYAPASNENNQRNQIFDGIINTLNSMNKSHPDLVHNLLIAGDFNFCLDSLSNHHTRRGTLPHNLLRFLGVHMHDCINNSNSSDPHLPTVKGTNVSRSYIDYLCISNTIRNNYSQAAASFINYKANPNLVNIPSDVQKIHKAIDVYVERHLSSTDRSPHDHLDSIKKVVAKLTRNHCRFRTKWREKRLKKLQQQRNHLYREYFNTKLLEALVESVETEIGSLQEEIAQIALLKAGKRLLENNKKSAGCLKRTATTREKQRGAQSFTHPVTGVNCNDPIIVEHPSCGELSKRIYNDALKGIFPQYWLETCVILLPKSGDLSDLINWRPITIINADFGFMRDQFIGDYGFALRLIMDDAHRTRSSSFGILLDQHKAYDCIHTVYLEKVLQAFGSPSGFQHITTKLFFSANLVVNVNGHLSRSIQSISSILFNLATLINSSM
ncbi:hypothetical protein A0J61_10552 [Choanephora cucurbitarum]|uniref:CCHC-type domain-containing protein n=1 Tax=Choanephora cucurbitarum TaxID=101091 RepID=A0A1C7MYB3_9FUNG|nr:hypothetical protein A0J61_10552 [Choanephora cucurbitarum]